MDSPQHCQEQAAECLRLVEKAQSKDEAQVLINISSSWSRLAGQIDRYNGIVRDQNRKVYINDTGTGNTVNLSHPRIIQMVTDSLRYWEQERHVDEARRSR